MRAVVIGLVLLFGAATLSACSSIDELFDDEQAAAIAAREAGIEKVPVVRIDNLELGRLFRGYMLIASGVAPDAGYYAPELRIRYDGELGADGFYEFDFVAAPPREPVGVANAPITARILRGDYELSPEMLRTARGVRVWSSRDSVEGRF